MHFKFAGEKTLVVMTFCVLMGLETLAILIKSTAADLDPARDFADFASKALFAVLVISLLWLYFLRRRKLVAKSKRRRRRYFSHRAEEPLMRLNRQDGNRIQPLGGEAD